MINPDEKVVSPSPVKRNRSVLDQWEFSGTEHKLQPATEWDLMLLRQEQIAKERQTLKSMYYPRLKVFASQYPPGYSR